MRRYSILLVIGLMLGLNAMAQTQVLENAIEHINKYTRISYTQLVRQKGSFSDDAIILNTKSSVNNGFDDNGKRVELYSQDDMRGFKYVFNGSTSFSLDEKNKTYRINNNTFETPFHSPFYWADFMQKHFIKSPEKIKMLPDTIVDHVLCFHVKFLSSVTPPGYNIYDLYLNKINYLPVYSKASSSGYFAEGLATMITENIYSHYVINSKKFPAIAAIGIPADFKPEKKQIPLSIGQKMPDWKLKDALGKSFSSNALQGKVTLIDFSFIACPDCALSLPALSRLYERYKETDINIISINTSDKKESVLKFIKNKHIKYPVLINGENIAKSFQVPDYPTFYIIDKQGNIAVFIDGYNDDLEKNLIVQIDKLK